MDRVKFNVMQGAPVPIDPKSFIGSWKFSPPPSPWPVIADPLRNELNELEYRLKVEKVKLEMAKNRWKRDMFKRRIEHLTTQIAAIKLSRE